MWNVGLTPTRTRAELRKMRDRIHAIRCPRCKFFAWDTTRMKPVRLLLSWHHPSCPAVRAR